MFSLCPQDKASIPSSWKEEKRVSTKESATDRVEYSERGTQFPDKAETGNQSLDSATMGTNYGDSLSPGIDYEPRKVAAFLERALPETEREMERTVRSQRNWQIWEKLWSRSENKAQALHAFSSNYLSSLVEDEHLAGKYIVAGLTWNSSGSIVAIGYRVEDHSDWCSHDSYLFLWNLFRSYSKHSKPSVVLEVEGCVSTIEAHPHQPSVYAVGTMSGKVMIFNTRHLMDSDAKGLLEDTYVRASSPSNFHQDAVTRLHWMRAAKTKGRGWQGWEESRVLSLGLDGRIFLWTINEDRKQLQPLNAFVILAEDLPRALGVKGSASRESQVGIVSSSVSPEDPTIFLVGCHGGALFKCSLDSATPARLQPDPDADFGLELELKTPISVSFAPHRAHVNAVQFCPTARNIFLSSAIDGELRIYGLLQSKPLLVIHCEVTLLSASWSPTRPNVYALQEDGILSVYSFKPNKLPTKPTMVLPSQGSDGAINFAVNYAERKEQLAITTNRGDTLIWDLSSSSPDYFSSSASSSDPSVDCGHIFRELATKE